MASSYRKINYSLRPAKNIERKMLCEALRRLIFIDNIDKYHYIGFGSIYFSDFKLFHNELNITKMTSIEKANHDKKRVEFNQPFSFIDLQFGESNIKLPNISYEEKSIIWLDYDSQLSTSIFEDIKTIVSRVKSGSIIMVTVNAQWSLSSHLNKEEKFEKFNQLKEKLGAEKFAGVNLLDVNGAKKFSKFSKKLIDNEVFRVLKDRNLGMATPMLYQQLFNFGYSDGAEMLTVGGIIYDESISSDVDQCKFRNLEFIRFDEEQYRIKIPNLTYKELAYLDFCIPLEKGDDLKVPLSEAQEYEKIYRYFPIFAESNL